MPELVPILEYIHALNSAGIPTKYVEAIAGPDELWQRLPMDAREQFLKDRGAEGTADRVGSISVLKRRGKPAAVENVFVLIDFEGETGFSGSAARARNRIFYEAFEPPRAPEAAEGLPGAGALFTEGGRAQGDIGRVLDLAWGDEPYDAYRDGVLCEPVLPHGATELDRYWLDEPFASVSVLKTSEGTLLYHVDEPQLTDLERALMVTLNGRLRDMLILEDDPEQFRSTHLLEKVFELLGMYRFRTDRRTAYKLGYYFIRNYLGFGRLGPVMHDGQVEDISCNGPGLPVFVAHNRYQSLPTNVTFSELELNSFTMKLAQRGGKLLSIAQPLVDATLPDGSRIQACLGREITSHGSAFTIRKFREDPLTAVDLIRMGTHSLDTMASLWLAVELRRSLLVMGATASGKTTTLNALCQFIPPTQKIVSIEDTREITLQHENWLAAITREGFSGGGTERVSMYDLLKAALRQRPEYLVVGEIRGVEGLTLFQAMSTGHTCFSTMHAGSVENAIYRLENAPIHVPRVMLTALDFFLVQGQVETGGRSARKMLALTEVNGLDPQTRNVRINELFRYDATSDTHQVAAESNVFERARARAGWSRARLQEELAARRSVLEGLVERDERHYGQVARAVREFYARRSDGEARDKPHDVAAPRERQAEIEASSAEGADPRVVAANGGRR